MNDFSRFIINLNQQCPALEILTDAADCWVYGYDNSRRQAVPQGVAFPTTHVQVKALVQTANQFKIPLIPRGRGTGTPGGSVPIEGGLVLSFEKMNNIIEIDPANRWAIVEPGVTNQELQIAAAMHGFFWAPDPTSAAYCTIGGNLAYNSAGPRAIKYGTPRENTLGLQIVTGSGADMRTGVFTTKGVVGYDLTRLIIGSEGTLAIITQAILKLLPLPESKNTLLAIYRDIHAATAAIAHIMAQPVTPCALEFMDQQAIAMIRNYSAIDLPNNAGALLIIEIDGALASLNELTDQISHAATNEGLLKLVKAQNPKEIALIWKTRKALSPALRNIAPKKINEDVVVPVSNIPALIAGLEKLATAYQIKIVNFGHAGNGNIHVNLLVDADNPTALAAAEHCLKEIFALVLTLQGTISGEHGIGYEKRQFIELELESAAIDLMKGIKQQFDANNILNPGKIFIA